jgi:TDG/mug DNA glycosylase family protein
VESAVPDVLAPDLRVVFCGINPGRASAAAGAHFANPRNDFWRLLHAAGFTPRRLDPSEQGQVLQYDIGLTNAAYRTTEGSGDLRRGDFAGSAERLERLARELVPAWIAFVGKEAYRGTFGERPELGVQERRLDATALFVLPSTSPANAAVPWEERLRRFGELAELSRPVLRPAVRALLLDEEGRIFLHRFVGPGEPGAWVAPGGAIEGGESPEAALRRELDEELRLAAPGLGPWVWRRRHRWYWPALRATLDSDERFAVVRVDDPERIAPTAHDSLFAGPDSVEEHRWWSAAEIAASADRFAPRRLAFHLQALLRDGPPTEPLDVGV